MRTIKFRAWDGKTMTDIVTTYTENDGANWWSADVVNIDTDDTIYSFGEGKGDKLMQFTERKDNNSAEIYDGDIVLINGMAKYKVIWSDYEYGWKYEYINKPGLVGLTLRQFGMEQDRIEIIGNIHENPELLK